MAELPQDVIEEAERLTRLARGAVDPNEAESYREHREQLLDEHGFTARIRSEEARTVLVLHPAEWLVDGVIQVERIRDTDRAVEIPLDGPGEPDDWDEVDRHNRELAAAVKEEHGDVHGANAMTLADFMSNHYARNIESATAEEIDEYLTEYYPRNAWPSDEQKTVVERSVWLVFETAGVSAPNR